MSWQMLDGPSRRPRLNWAVPEHLRDNTRYGPFRRLAVPGPLDPDALLQYMDNAISITENAQATRQLSLLFKSSSSVASSSSSPSPLPLSSLPSAPVLTSSSLSSTSLSPSAPAVAPSLLVGPLADPGPSLPVPSTRRVSRFKSVPLHMTAYMISSSKEKDQEEAAKLTVSKSKAREPGDEQGSFETDTSSSGVLDGSTKEETVSEVEQTSGKEEEDNARAADDAYRAACCALSEGNAELAISLLHVASEKCPPNKQNALAKVHRLMAAAMQLLEKNSAVLKSFPVDKDPQ